MSQKPNPFHRGYWNLKIVRTLCISYEDGSPHVWRNIHASQQHLSDEELVSSSCIVATSSRATSGMVGNCTLSKNSVRCGIGEPSRGSLTNPKTQAFVLQCNGLRTHTQGTLSNSAFGLRGNALFFGCCDFVVPLRPRPRLRVCPNPLQRCTHHFGKPSMPGRTTSVKNGLPRCAALAKTR